MPETSVNPLLKNDLFCDILRRVNLLEQETKRDNATIQTLESRIIILETSLRQAQDDLRWTDIQYAYIQIKENPHNLHKATIQTYELIIWVLDYFKSRNYILDHYKYAIRKEFLTPDQIEYIRLKYELDLNT